MFPLTTAAHDWRLVPAAVVIWASALVALLVHWAFGLLVGGLAVLVGCVLLIRCPGLRGRISLAWPLLVCGVLALWPVTGEVRVAATDPLRAMALAGDVVQLRVGVEERPKPVRSPGFAGMQAGVRSVVIPASVEHGGEVLLLAPVDGWAGLLPGQRVSVSGTLAPAERGHMTVAVVRVRGKPTDVSPASVVQSAARDVRAGLRRVAEVLGGERAALLPALVVGDSDALGQSTVEGFEAAGLSHLLAVSGANLAIVGVAVLFVMRLAGAGPGVAALGAGLGLVGFIVLVGPEPSVLRAGVMGGVGLLALALGRERSALPALAASVVLLVLFDPGMAVSVGFALSVLATGALVLMAPRWVTACQRRRVPRVLAEAVAVPAAAHVVTAPVVAGISGQISLVAVAANLVAAPVVAPATVFGVLAAVIAPVWPWLAEWAVRAAGPEVGWLIWVGRQAAGVPGAVIDWPDGWVGGLLLAMVCALLVLALRRRWSRVLVAVGLVGVLIVVVPVRVLAPRWPPTGWAVVACDVGQGDAVVLATGEPRRAVVVDTGPDPRPIGDCLDRLGVRNIPLVVLSHLHADHVGGLSAVLTGRQVGGVAVGPGRTPDWAWQQVRAQAAEAGIPVLDLTSHLRLQWPALRLDVLYPMDGEVGDETDGTAINNRSLVILATTSAGRVLLTGDVELAAQAELLRAGADVRADIIKVPHHGSRYTAPDFLSAVRARIALVSVGSGNRYGHPSSMTMAALRRLGVLVSRTDEDGDVAVVRGSPLSAVVRRGRSRGPPLRAGSLMPAP